MLAKRIIPCLDVDNGRVVKGVQFLDIRDAGDPVEVARRYNEQGADEITFLDITATSNGRDTTYRTVERMAESVFVPLTVGGGVRKVEDIRLLLNAGADGIVFGCLRQNGTIDESACMRLLDEIGNHTSVFHRAFDMIGDNFEPAIDTLVRLGVSRVLTSGGAYTATAGIPRLRQIKAYAGNDIDILPCGKIRADNAARIMRETGINSVHTSATTEELDVTGEYNEAVSFVGKELPRSGAYTGCNGDILSHFVKTVRGSMRL